jgi:hypothetical protein
LYIRGRGNLKETEIRRPFAAGCLIYAVFQPKINYRIFYALREYLRIVYNLSGFTTAMMSDGFYWSMRLNGRRRFKRFWKEQLAQYKNTEEGTRFKELLVGLKSKFFESTPAPDEGFYEEITRRTIMEELKRM